ncbi:MAG: hypothetical protein PHT13_00245 [Methanosarcina sp.]|jgi:hypothetical protein|nr:hypothetical protein [Methanosarcina sp.]
MAYIIQLRRDTAANWAAANPKLESGEMGFQTDGLKLIKVGDGETDWNDLPVYFQLPEVQPQTFTRSFMLGGF